MAASTGVVLWIEQTEMLMILEHAKKCLYLQPLGKPGFHLSTRLMELRRALIWGK